MVIRVERSSQTLDTNRLNSSFRDPSGFVYRWNGQIFRHVDASYRNEYEAVKQAGLFEELWNRGWLIRHDEVDQPAMEGAYATLRPEQLRCITYPYEWCFSQLKDAALLTLDIARLALDAGFVLKDASAYNVQFRGAKACLIDTLSFRRYREGEAWVAYGQFCRHFLAPLLLMAFRDVSLGRLLANHIDGIPLALATRLLPGRARMWPSLQLHLFLHARSERRFLNNSRKVSPRVSKRGLVGILDSLRGTVASCTWRTGQTEWGDYYKITNYSADAFEAKRRLVGEAIAIAQPGYVWDLGANDGTFSRLVSNQRIPVLAWDIDPVAVERNHQEGKRRGEQYLTPALVDLMNPSPALGWNGREREGFFERNKPDLVICLALIHHLAIGNNVPLPQVVAMLQRLGAWVLVEFVPKHDSKVQELLRNREDIFPDYTEAAFKAAFLRAFDVAWNRPIPGTDRSLYLFRRRDVV